MYGSRILILGVLKAAFIKDPLSWVCSSGGKLPLRLPASMDKHCLGLGEVLWLFYKRTLLVSGAQLPILQIAWFMGRGYCRERQPTLSVDWASKEIVQRGKVHCNHAETVPRCPAHSNWNRFYLMSSAPDIRRSRTPGR